MKHIKLFENFRNEFDAIFEDDGDIIKIYEKDLIKYFADNYGYTIEQIECHNDEIIAHIYPIGEHTYFKILLKMEDEIENQTFVDWIDIKNHLLTISFKKPVELY